MAVALLDSIAVSAELVVGMSTDKVHCWQLELLVTLTAILLVKVLAGALHSQNVLAHRLNPLSHLLDSRLVNVAFFIELAL